MNENLESKNVLKATGTVAGGQIVTIIIGLIRTKIIAIVLGPSGVGVVGLLTTMTDMVRNLTSFGIPFSGVRDISIADAANDTKATSRIIKIFNKWVLVSASLSALIVLIFCLPLGRYLFKNDSYTFGIAFLSISVFFTAISSGYATVMQGKRAISMMVKSGIISTLLSSIIAVVLYFIFEEDGIVPVIIISSIINFIVSFYFYKKLIIVKHDKITFLESWQGAKTMIRIGFFTTIVSVFDQIMSLVLRAFLSDKVGVDGVGLFTASNTIATLYLSLVLTSMASDFYPKLASIHTDNKSLNDAVNNQLYITLLLACPIILGMVGFGEIAIQLLYSDKFLGAVEVLKWQVLGDFFKIIAWPFGYVFLAKGLGKVFVGLNVSYTALYITIIFLGWNYFGFLGIGLAFFIAQLCSVIFTCSYNFNKFGIFISKKNFKLIIIYILLLGADFAAQELFEGLIKFLFSGFLMVIAIAFSAYHLNSLISIKSIFIKIKNIKK